MSSRGQQSLKTLRLGPASRWPTLVVLFFLGATSYSAWHFRQQAVRSETRLGHAERGQHDLSQQLAQLQSERDGVDKAAADCAAALEEERIRSADRRNRLNAAEAELGICAGVGDPEQLKARAAALADESARLGTRFRAITGAGQLEIERRRGQTVVAIPAEVLFSLGSATLSDPGRQALTAIANVLKSMGERQLTVAGHTDDRPVGRSEFADNRALSAARAVAVTAALAGAGVPAAKLVAAGYGQYAPVASNDTEAGRRRNRRIEIVLAPDPAQLSPAPATVDRRAGKRRAARRGKRRR
jgi:chemotaxis protein MotB